MAKLEHGLGIDSTESLLSRLPFMRLYTSLEQLGLDETATIQETWAAMPDKSQLEIGVGQYANLNWNCPVVLGEISIVRLGEPRGHIWLYSKISTQPDYRMHLDNNEPTGVWYALPIGTAVTSMNSEEVK